MGKTSTESRFNLPGRYAWCVAEVVGPLNMLFVIYSLPSTSRATVASGSSIFGTGLPFTHELLAMLYVLHYINRAFITPIFYAPSMSPIHAGVALSMAMFQYMNSACLASWLTYSASNYSRTSTSSIFGSLIGLTLFAVGLYGNISAEHALFSLRRAAAKRKARSEGKATITYDKVYVIPPVEGWFKQILYPHYVCEYLEWTGYWIIGGSLGLGWNTPALWFLINELSTMTPRAVTGRKWYAGKFGAKAVAGRGGVAPVSWL